MYVGAYLLHINTKFTVIKLDYCNFNHQIETEIRLFILILILKHTSILQTFTVLLDTLNDFIVSYRGELNDFLYFLLVRLLARIGVESLASVQTKLTRTLDVIRDNFSAHLQFHNIVRYLNDPTQTPGVKVCICTYVYVVSATVYL